MSEAEKIAVAGATGRVGHHVVDVLTERGHDVVSLSRSNGVDVITGEGLAKALAGVEGIVDTATGPSPEQQAATEFFTTAAKSVQEAGEPAGVQRNRRRTDSGNSCSGARGVTSPTFRSCARSWSPRARSRKRSPTWPPTRGRRPGRRSRSPGHARRAWSRWQGFSSPDGETRYASRPYATR